MNRSIAFCVAIGVILASGPACWLSSAPQSDPGPAGGPGPQGDGGVSGAVADPSFGVVLPMTGVIERVVDVEVVLASAKIDATTTLDFGPDIQVLDVKPSGPTSVRARLVIAYKAAVGPRDVVATTGTTKVRGHEAFTVTAAVEVSILTPTPVYQGSIIGFECRNMDLAHSFDPATSVVSESHLAPIYNGTMTGKYVSSGGVVAPGGSGAAAVQRAELRQRDPHRFHPGALLSATVVAKAPIPMTAPLLGEKILEPHTTKIYRYTVPSPFVGFVKIEMATGYTTPLWPMIFLYDGLGKPADYLGYVALGGVQILKPKIAPMVVPYYTTAPSDLYIVGSDYTSGGGPDYVYDMTPTPVTTAGYVEVAGAHDTLPGQSLSSCVVGGALVSCVVQGTISAVGQVDVYRLQGLTADTAINVEMVTDRSAELWVQDGALTTVDPKNSDFIDWNTGTPAIVGSRDTKLASGSSNDLFKSWTIVVRSSGGKTGSYVLGFFGSDWK